MGADDMTHREVGDRRVDMRHQMQPARSDPGSLYIDVGEVDRDELTNLGMAVRTPGESIRLEFITL
jgi:hypothetical protein